MPIRDKVYDKLKSIGLTDSKEDFFKYYDNDENVRKQAYNKLRDAGLTDSEEDFYGYMKPQQAMDEQIKAQSSNEPYTHVYDKDMNLVGGTAYQAPEPYQYKPEVQQHIVENIPDMFKAKTGNLVDRPVGIGATEEPKFDITNVGDSFANTINDAYATSNEMGERMNARIGMLAKNAQDPFVQKGRSEADMRGLTTEIDSLLESEHKKLKPNVSVGQKGLNAIMGSNQYNQSTKDTRKNVSNLEAAKRLMEQSKYIVDAAHRGDTGVLSDTWKGFKDSLEAEDFTFGLADMSSSAAILDAIKKVERGEKLTASEDKLLKASAINMAIQYNFANDLGRAYKAGLVSAESVPFMLEMAINPISSFGKASAKTLLNYGLKAYAKQVGKGLLKGAAAGAGMAATTGAGRVASGAMDKLAGNYNYGVDMDGNLYAEKKENTTGVGEAVARSFASTAIENQSEMIFNAFKGVGGFMKGVQDILPGGVNRFFNMLSHNKVADAYRWLKNSPVFRNYLVKDIRNATQIGGLGEEYLEEVYNNLANFAIGEMSWEDVTSLDKNIDTLLGLAPTQVMFGILGLGGAGAMRYQTRRTLEDLQATMNEQQRRELEGLLDMGIDAKGTDVRGFIRSVMANQNYTIENKRDLIKAAYYVAKQKGIDEMAEADVVEKVNAEYSLIDSMTDPSTGTYAEVNRLVINPETGEREAQPGYVVGWIGEGDKRQPIFVADGMENTYENRVVLKPTEWEKESYQEMPAEQVKAVSEEMIREEAAQQAEQEAKYAPEVLNAQMPEGEFTMGGQLFVPSQVTSDGVVYDIFNLNEKRKPTTTIPIESRPVAIDEYRDMLQAQLNAEEAAQEQIAAEGQAAAPEVVEEVQPTEEADVKENFTTETGNNLSPVEEVAQPQAEVKPQTPVIPTKEDGSIDFVSYGKEGTFKTLGEKYGEKMPNKVAVTAKALAEDLKNAQNKLQKAEEAYDNAPIGREQKAEGARDKAKQELEAIQREANFWAEMDAEIKDVQARRESMLNPQAEVETSTEPMNVDEFVAQHLASGNIILDKEDYKKETGYGDEEANAMNGGTQKLLTENGMTIQEAGERLMEIDRENGTNFFDQLDSNSGRDALINVLGSVKSRKELNQYIASNRAEQVKRESEGLRNKLEKQAMEAHYASLEDYVLQMEAAEMEENPFKDIDVAQIDAIFVESEEEYQNYINNEQGRTSEVVEGDNNVLSEEQSDNTGGTSGIESEGNSERNGEGASEESESTHAATEVELKQEEGETALQFAERAAEENRRRPLRKRAEEWSKALGVKVHFIEKLDDVDNQTAYIALSKGSKVAGWYEGTTGKVFFYMPNLDDISEVDKTYIHEVVAHKGLREMLGRKRFNELCDKVWDMMPDTEKAKFIGYPGVNGNTRAAADEYIAYLSEKENLTPEEKTMWDRVVKVFRDIFETALNAIIGKVNLTDEDISNLIKASYANLKSGAEGVSGEGTRFSVIERANEEFNKQLDEFKNKAHRGLLSLGAPQDILRRIGVNVNEITISPTILHRHLKKHHLDIEDLKGLASAIQNPILSYKHGKRFPNLVIVTEMNVKGGKLSVSLELDESGSVVEISNVKSVHSKEALTELQRLSELSEEELKSSLKWVEKEKVSEWLLRLPYEDERTISNQKLNSIANIINSFENPKTIEENLPSFRVVEDKNGRKSLIGLHNISEAKLKKAIKQGGLANPSMAVIDLYKQSHVDYGDITLVAPESLVDKKLGKNVGTYMADAYTPIYPTVVKQMTDKGYKAFNKSLDDVNEFFRSKVRSYFNSYLDTGTIYDALYYWYLSDTGKNPPTLEAALPSDFTREEVDKVKSINPEADSFFQLPEEDKQKVLSLYAERYYNGIEAYKEYLADYIKRMQEVVNDESKPAMVRNRIQKNLSEIENYGFEYDYVAAYYNRGMTLASRQSKPSDVETFSNARNEVVKKGLNDEFNQWLANKESDLGVEEKLFKGYDNQGRAKYVPNTLENASKLMKKEGRAGATGYGGFNEFVAVLAPVAKTTKELNKKKQNLSTKEAYDEFVEQWSGHYHDLAQKLQPGADKWADYGYHRLQEIAPMANPRDYVKREYGIELSDEFIKDLNDIKTAIKNDFPARYFETKFERPVYLNEFAAAVVPQGTSKDVVDALTKVGLPIEEYESGNNEARMAAIDKVSSEMGGIRFRFIGERGARNLDKTEEATTRLDNLNVAREMEAAEKDAKAIKMATGWERGADGKWRYETEDVKLKGFDWISQKKALKLQDIVDDNELFTAYPILSEIKIKKGRGYRGGSYSNEKKELELKLGEIREDIKYFGYVTSYNEKYFKETVIHEIQHAIQDIEGFASGGSSSTIIDQQIWDKINKLTAEVDELYAEWDRMPDSEKKITNPVAKRMNDEVGAKRKEIDRLFKDGAIGYEGYKKLSGEVEARNAATRMNMSEEERRKTLASETEDVAREDQIFLKDGIESGMRFRLSEKGKQIQAEVDKFTSKYNSKPVIASEVNSMADEDIEDMFDADASEVKDAAEKGMIGGYDEKTDKIYIFAENQTLDDLEDTLFHENLHALFHGNSMIGGFDEASKDKFLKNRANIQKVYKEDMWAEEMFVKVAADAMAKGDFKYIEKYLPDEYKEEFYNTIKDFGYEREEESERRRIVRPGTGGQVEGQEVSQTRGLGEDAKEPQAEQLDPRERKERLTDLFNKVADMGLEGVLGNKEYTSAMVDIYKALPNEVRAELAEDALRNYGGSVAPAVSDYLNVKAEPSVWDKVVTIVREALRKVGFDLDLNGNEVRYMVWRSKKTLDRNNLLEVAEDIDMKNRLKVGEYDGTTPDGGGTRSRTSEDVLNQIKQARREVEKNPSEAQKEAGNYKKGHITLDGFEITLENPKGGTRSGVDKNGKKWNITMNNDYGYIRGTEAVDGDHIDVFLSDNPTEGRVFVVDQLNKEGFFDESKVMYGFDTLNEARDAYLSNYEKGWEKRIMAITEVSKEEFKKWIDSSHRKTKAFCEYKSINSNNDDIRFRVANKLQVRDEYEATIRKGGYQAREAVQDAMLSLRKFQELIEKASGKKIRDFENAWMHENRLSSVVQAEIHDMERKFYKPMMDAVKKLMKAANLEQEQVADYLMLKHGIERNREMAVRKALTDSEGKIDRTRLEQWYQDKRNVRSRAATPHLDTWRKQQEELDNIALIYGADMSRDYSGLTSMFGTDDLADSTQQAYDEVEALETAHPVETEALGKAIKAMTQNTLDESFGSGLMDRKVYDELSKDMYDYYIPLRGFDETTSEEVYAYLDQDRGAFNAPLVRAKGRSSKSDNPIAYLKSIAESGIMQGNRNKMKQSFLNMVINNPSDLVSVREGVWAIFNPASGEWEAATPPTIPNNATPADVEAAMEAWEQQMEQAALKDPTLVKKVAEAADVPYRVVGNKMDQHQIIVKRLGKSYTLTINGNPRLAMAINGQTNPNNTSNDGKVAAFVNNKIGSINRSLAAWYTTRNPDFVASNFMRDTFYTNTIVRAKEGNAYANKFHKNYAKVLPQMLVLFSKYEKGTLNPASPTEAAFIDFMMNGGETGYSNLKDVEEIKKQITKALKESKWDKAVTAVGLKALRRENVEALAEKLDILNRAVENTARFAAYLTSREEGRSIAKSVFDAKEISVNFNKKGAGGTFFGMTGQTWFGNLAAMVGASGRALYVFFNAAIQGSTNLMHVMKVNPKGTSAGLAAMFLMGAVVPFLFGDDDEKDYYDLPEHVRRNHLIIPGAGDAWISIPLPIEYRIMYGIGELLTSWRTGHERGTDIARKMLSMTGQALPLNFLEEGLEAFVPSAASPIYQVMTNSSWTGLPIYKENDFNKDDPEYTKAYSNVDRNLLKFTKALYEWTFDEENQEEGIDLNPAIIETLAKGYFGGLATQLSNLAKVGGMIAGEQEFDWRNIPIGNRILKTGDERTKEKRVNNEYFENMEKLDFLQSRERRLKKAEKGVAVPEADKFNAQKDLETMQGTEIYKKYQKFKKQKKVVDKIRKTIKEKGSTPEREKQLMEAQEAANKAVR